MTSPTSHQIIAAASDPDLRARARALAATLDGLTPTDIDTAMQRLVATPIIVAGQDTSVAATYDYALQTRPPAPGINPAAVTDQHLLAALQAIRP